MARYIKANPKVAAFLGLTRDRNTVKDGNYLLWQADMLAFGPLTQLQETLTQIGGLALLAHEAREEQDGTVSRPLPTPTDPRFIIDAAAQKPRRSRGSARQRRNRRRPRTGRRQPDRRTRKRRLSYEQRKCNQDY